MDSILSQMIDYYYNEHGGKDPIEDVKAYYFKLLSNYNIIYLTDERGLITGFIEFYLINKMQAQRLLEKKPFEPRSEDITSGDVCYIHDIWIRPDHRTNGGYAMIKKMRRLAEKTHGKKADVIVGINYKRKLEGKIKLFKGGG